MQEQKAVAHLSLNEGGGIAGSRFRPGTEVAKDPGLPRPNILLVTTDQQVITWPCVGTALDLMNNVPAQYGIR